MVLVGFKWKEIAQQLPNRVGKAIHDRYVNFLDPRLKKTPWTKEEDAILLQNQHIIGNKWTEIRTLLPGRSENSIKNRYHNRKNMNSNKNSMSSIVGTDAIGNHPKMSPLVSSKLKRFHNSLTTATATTKKVGSSPSYSSTSTGISIKHHVITTTEEGRTSTELISSHKNDVPSSDQQMLSDLQKKPLAIRSTTMPTTSIPILYDDTVNDDEIEEILYGSSDKDENGNESVLSLSPLKKKARYDSSCVRGNGNTSVPSEVDTNNNNNDNKSRTSPPQNQKEESMTRSRATKKRKTNDVINANDVPTKFDDDSDGGNKKNNNIVHQDNHERKRSAYKPWNSWLLKLVDYKNEFGNTDVPRKYARNKQLGRWVNTQRSHYKRNINGKPNSITKERIESLNKLGFKWDVNKFATPWEERRQQLADFKVEFNHTNVTQSNTFSRKMGSTVS